MTDLHKFSLGEIPEPKPEYRKAKTKGEKDSKGRNMPIRKRKLEIKVEMTTGEFELFKKQVNKIADNITERREKCL